MSGKRVSTPDLLVKIRQHNDEGLCEDMNTSPTPQTVVVTGAAGYIGRHVVVALLDRGFDVRAVVRAGRGSEVDSRATLIEADLFADETDLDAVLGENTQALIHLAWQDGFKHNAPSHMHNVSNHFDFVTAASSRVPRVAVLGTMHEVGYWEGAITADTPTNPRSQYGVAKDALRRSLLLEQSDGSELVWLRCYYIVGDDRRSNSIFTRLLDAVDAGRPTLPFTSGANKYDFIDVDDLAAQIAVASTTAGVVGVLNCSSGLPVSLAERVELFIRDEQLPISLEYGAFPDRPYDSPAVWGDSREIEQIMAEHILPQAGAADPARFNLNS